MGCSTTFTVNFKSECYRLDEYTGDPWTWYSDDDKLKMEAGTDIRSPLHTWIIPYPLPELWSGDNFYERCGTFDYLCDESPCLASGAWLTFTHQTSLPNSLVTSFWQSDFQSDDSATITVSPYVQPESPYELTWHPTFTATPKLWSAYLPTVKFSTDVISYTIRDYCLGMTLNDGLKVEVDTEDTLESILFDQETRTLTLVKAVDSP